GGMGAGMEGMMKSMMGVGMGPRGGMGPMGGSGMMMGGRGGMMEGMMRRMGGMGGPMGPGMMGIGGETAEMKKQMKMLSRTDFLLQFVWKPVKPEDGPKTDEERNEKIKSVLADLRKAEEKNPAVRTGDIEKQLEAASRKKSDQLDSQM